MTRTLRPALAVLATSLAFVGYADVGAAQPSPPPPAAPAADVASAVDAVQRFYDGSRTFKADFDQRYGIKAYGNMPDKTSRGHVTFAKPGKMDWVYEDPQGNRVVSDGSVIKVYEAANKQMYEQPIVQSQYPMALSFLTGTGKLADNFDFEVMSGQTMKFPGGDVLVGTPKQPTAAYAKVLFYIDTATSQVRRVLIIDGQGNRNRFDFKNPRINEALAPGQFSFTPPPGTTIIHP
jgi:outer membrane lipoprotein carrier protein